MGFNSAFKGLNLLVRFGGSGDVVMVVVVVAW
jgi:hypothetical protein